MSVTWYRRTSLSRAQDVLDYIDWINELLWREQHRSDPTVDWQPDLSWDECGRVAVVAAPGDVEPPDPAARIRGPARRAALLASAGTELMSLTVGEYGSTFIATARRCWRLPPSGRPRLVIRSGREIVLPWWLALRIEPVLKLRRP